MTNHDMPMTKLTAVIVGDQVTWDTPLTHEQALVFAAALLPRVTVEALSAWYDQQTIEKGCGECRVCIDQYADALEEVGDEDRALMLRAGTFIVCPDCGNKRCPKATYHDHACTKSNDSGQVGSIYGTLHAYNEFACSPQCQGCKYLQGES